MTILTYNDFYAQMGLVEATLMNPIPGATWPTKAWISAGNRLKGDVLNDDWVGAYSGLAQFPTLQSMWWSDVVGWINIQPGANNTTTNAAVIVYDFQTHIFNTTTQAWEKISSYSNRNNTAMGYYVTNTYAYEGAADRIYTGRNNIPRFCCTKLAVATDRDTSSSDTSKYRAVHNGLSRQTVDPTIVGGVAVMCRAKLEPISGSLNGTTEILIQVGADMYPNSTDIVGGGLLAGVSSVPALGASGFSLIGVTERIFLYVTSNINANCYVETRSDYVRSFPAGTYPHCMAPSLFTTKIPQFKNF